MLLRSDPFRELDRLNQAVFGSRVHADGMAFDAYRQGDQFVAHFDLPGVDPESIDLTIENDVLTVSAERTWRPDEGAQVVASERFHGRMTRRMLLGEAVDTDAVEASYENGVLTVVMPIAEQAKPRRIEVTAGSGTRAITAGSKAA